MNERRVRRVALAGVSGSGKTTLGKTLATRLGVAHVELDAFHNLANWQVASKEQITRQAIAALDGREGWVVEPIHSVSPLSDWVLERADVHVWLDLSLAVIFSRLARRSFWRIVRREELWNGNRESFRTAFLDPDALFPETLRRHRTLPGRLDGLRAKHPNVRFVRLGRARDVARWLDSVDCQRT